MEKEMKPGITVGDKVVTPKGEWGVVSDFTSLGTAAIVQIRRRQHTQGVFEETTWNQLWKPDQLRRVNIYDIAGEAWRLEWLGRLVAIEKSLRPAIPTFKAKYWTGAVKEMKPKFKVGDIVKTPTGEFATVVPLEADSIDDITQVKALDGTEVVFLTRHLKETHLKDGAAAYISEGHKAPEDNICYSARYISAMEKAVREAYQAPSQPIFRLVNNDGWYEGGGMHYVLLAEDEREMLVQEVDLDKAQVSKDQVYSRLKSNWARDYSIGDEIIDYLNSKGGNFTNKLVDKS